MKYSGLSLSKVKKLQFQYGPNSLPQEKTTSAIKIFLSQFTNPLIYLLFLAGLISLFLQKYLDIVFIFSVVLLNSLFGFFQEYKAQKTLIALRKLIKPLAKVSRDNKRQQIDAIGLVPGDIVFLITGDKIPADGKILEAASFLVNEAILTGESEAVAKEKKDEVFMGTIVMSGRAVVQVTRIGLETKIGEIAKTLKETSQPLTTLQQRFKKVTRTLIYISILLSVLLFALGFLTGKDFWQMVQMAAIILVAIIPEAMLIVITLILVIAMQNTLKKKALIRRLLAVETLGSVTTICTDKTGTLTEGKMKVSEEYFLNRQNSLLAMCLCNDLSDTAEIALWDYLEKQDDFYSQETFDKHKRVSEIPFSSDYKFMATVNYYPSEDDRDFLLSVKGAPEIVLEMSDLPAKDK
ncbi:MAG: HAD-IC family P-type ATPase, partial [Candidatus Paceibacterota bacterium]